MGYSRDDVTMVILHKNSQFLTLKNFSELFLLILWFTCDILALLKLVWLIDWLIDWLTVHFRGCLAYPSQWPCWGLQYRPTVDLITKQQCVCVCWNMVEVYACMMYEVSSLCPVYFGSLATLHLPATALAVPSHATHTVTGRQSLKSSYDLTGTVGSTSVVHRGPF